MGREADRRMNTDEEDGIVRFGGAVNCHQLECVVVVAVEDGADYITNFIKWYS